MQLIRVRSTNSSEEHCLPGQNCQSIELPRCISLTFTFIWWPCLCYGRMIRRTLCQFSNPTQHSRQIIPLPLMMVKPPISSVLQDDNIVTIGPNITKRRRALIFTCTWEQPRITITILLVIRSPWRAASGHQRAWVRISRSLTHWLLARTSLQTLVQRIQILEEDQLQRRSDARVEPYRLGHQRPCMCIRHHIVATFPLHNWVELEEVDRESIAKDGRQRADLPPPVTDLLEEDRQDLIKETAEVLATGRLLVGDIKIGAKAEGLELAKDLRDGLEGGGSRGGASGHGRRRRRAGRGRAASGGARGLPLALRHPERGGARMREEKGYKAERERVPTATGDDRFLQGGEKIKKTGMTRGEEGKIFFIFLFFLSFLIFICVYF